MRPFAWIVLGMVGVFSAVLLIVAIGVHSEKPSIANVTSDEYAHMISTVAAKNNTHFANSTVTGIQYVEDTLAVVAAKTGDGTAMTFVFEYYNGTLFLTNYTSGEFTKDDFNNPSIAPYINGAMSAM